MPIQENIASSRSQYKKMLASRGNWEWLNCDSSRGIRWNIVWALGKSRAPPPWFSSGPGSISSHTPPLVTLQLQYSLPTQISTTLYWFSFNNQPIVCANTWLHVHAYYWQICDLASRMLNHCTVRQKGPNVFFYKIKIDQNFVGDNLPHCKQSHKGGVSKTFFVFNKL